MSGPCEPWVTAEELPAACADVSAENKVRGIVAATNVLYGMSGQKYTGTCTRTYRPGGLCGCPRPTIIQLPTRPVHEIEYVKIDGVDLDPSEYEIRDRRFLARMLDADGQNPGWPIVQKALPPTEEGTWEISYTWGLAVPEVGRMAAAVLACRFARTLDGDNDCGLNERARSVVRQGTDFTLHDPEQLKELDLVGMAEVDLFLQTVNPSKQRVRSEVWSPDIAVGGYRVS